MLAWWRSLIVVNDTRRQTAKCYYQLRSPSKAHRLAHTESLIRIIAGGAVLEKDTTIPSVLSPDDFTPHRTTQPEKSHPILKILLVGVVLVLVLLLIKRF